MEVLEDEHDGLRLREHLDESAPGGERLAELRLPGSRLLHPAQREEVALDPRPLGLVGEEVSDSRSDLRDGLLGPVALEDARLSFHDLGEAPKGRSLAVRERATLPPDDELRIGIDPLEELAHETRLPDPGTPTTVTSCGSSRVRARQGADQDVRSSSVRPGRAHVREIDAVAGPSSDRAPDRERPFPAATGASTSYSIARSVARKVYSPTRMPPAARSRLQPRARVHDVTGHDPPSSGRASSATSASPVFTPIRTSSASASVRLVHLGDRLLIAEGAHGSFRVVFVRCRRAEDTDDGVPDELLDRTSMPLEVVT